MLQQKQKQLQIADWPVKRLPSCTGVFSASRVEYLLVMAPPTNFLRPRSGDQTQPTVSQERLVHQQSGNRSDPSFTWLHLDPEETNAMRGDKKLDSASHELSVTETATSRGTARPPSATSRGTAWPPNEIVYKTYKRRWFGLLQLILLNIVVSWDVSLFARHSVT